MEIKSQLVAPLVEEGALRVAFATRDELHVNAHFGWAEEFILYDVSKKGYSKSGKIVFTPREEDECDHETKNNHKIKALNGCHLVYSEAIGGPVAARMTQNKIQPLVAKDQPTIESILLKLKTVLNGTTPPWLKKLIKTDDDPERFDRFDEDEEDEE